MGIATKILFALLALSTVIVLYPSMAGARKRAIMSQARIYFEQCSEMLEFLQEQVFSCEDSELELSKPRAVIKSYVLRGTGADYTLVVLAGQGNHSVTLEGNVEKGMTVLQNH